MNPSIFNSQKQGNDNERSPQDLAIFAVLFSLMGGLELGLGIDRLRNVRPEYNWVLSFLLGLVFLANGIICAAKLVRRASAKNPSAQTTTSGM